LFIDMLLASPASVSVTDLQELEARMHFIRRSAETLIDYMKKQSRRLSRIPEPD
jgi:hypothetical protein